MQSHVRAALAATLSGKFALSKSRLETLISLLIAMVSSRTVNLTHAACHLPGEALHASRYRRLQRFFQHVRLDQDAVAQLVIKMLNLANRPVPLALDRTNWQVGSKDINILVLAVVTRRFRMPLMWTLLTHQGNSDTQQRIALMERYLALFGAASIQWLLADREFVGSRWMDFLSKNNIPFAIRVKQSLTIVLDNGKICSLKTLLRHRRARRAVYSFEGQIPETATPVRVAARQLKTDDWLIVMTNGEDGAAALRAYRKRWGIECLFGDAKTRGLNLEDTRLTNPGKLATLLGILALAMSWAYRCATQTMGYRAIARKKHGRREKSWFRVGLDALRTSLHASCERALSAWTNRPQRA
ncbi:MAG: IS4 family transposase [Sphingomonadales bacterium]|nr:IS4 family transposase [Sphingomonadales bacterium]